MAYGDYTRSTVLEAVNVMIGILGKRPVSDIDSSGVSEAVIARDILHEFSRFVQTVGWTFNTDTDYPLTPDSETSIITIPTNALVCDPSAWYEDQYVERAGKIYDKENRTNVLTITSLKCDITWFLEFTDLPEAARRYIEVLAGRKFQDRFQADKASWQFTQDDELKAWASMKRYELNQMDFSLLDNTYMNRAVLRRR